MEISLARHEFLCHDVGMSEILGVLTTQCLAAGRRDGGDRRRARSAGGAFLSALFDWDLGTWGGARDWATTPFALSGELPVLGLAKHEGLHGFHHDGTSLRRRSMRPSRAATEDGATTVAPRMDVMDQGSMAILVDPLESGTVRSLAGGERLPVLSVMHELNAPGWFDQLLK